MWNIVVSRGGSPAADGPAGVQDRAVVRTAQARRLAKRGKHLMMGKHGYQLKHSSQLLLA